MKNNVAALIAILFFAFETHAQEPPRPLELGIQITGVHLHKIDETPFGFGGRLLFDFSKHASLDAELDHYPENPSGNFGETAVLAGLRSVARWGRFGAFAKARAGVMHFGGGFFDQRLERKTLMDIDLGGGLEFYPSPHTTVRIDLGDTVLFYGSQPLRPNPRTLPLGTVHNFQPMLGVGFRF